MKTKVITTLAAIMAFFYSHSQTLYINDVDLGSQLDGVRYASFSFPQYLPTVFWVDIKFDERGSINIKDEKGKSWKTQSIAHFLNELDKIRPIKEVHPAINGTNIALLVEFKLE